MKKTAFVIGADYHIHKGNIELVKLIAEQHMDVCIEKDTEHMIIAGDMFTNRSSQSLDVLLAFSEIVKKASKRGLTVHIIPGNHDKTSLTASDSYLDVFSRKNLKIYRGGSVVIINGLTTVFIPFFPEEIWMSHLDESLREINESHLADSSKVMITHIAVDGVKNNDGSVVKSSITKDLLNEFDNIFVGHYHNASSIANNIHYTGSVYQNNYGETINDKGFTVVDIEGNFEKVNSQFPKYLKEYIPAKDTPALEKAIKKHSKNFENNFVRFIFTGSKHDCQSIPMSELSSMGIDVKFETDESNNAIINAEESDVLSFDKQTLKKDFLSYCKEANIKGVRLRYGLELLKEL